MRFKITWFPNTKRSFRYNEFSNFTKLRFHALVAKVDRKPGYWLITARGGQFLRGEIAVPQRVKTFRNKVLDHSREMIHILQLKGKVPEFQKEYAYEYQGPAATKRIEQPNLFVA
jgi:hypothetical protein